MFAENNSNGCPSNMGGTVTLRDNCAFSHNRIQADMNITLLGCGLMGTPMTRRLLAAGYPLSVWSRKLEQRQQFGNRGTATPSVTTA